MPLLAAAGLEGLGDVFANLDRIQKRIGDDAAKQALDEQGDTMVEEVIANTPVESGAAAGTVRKLGRATPTEVVVIAGGADAIYFPLIEFGGTHNRQPTAPFRRSLEKRRMVMLTEVRDSIRDTVPELED